jgi:hypothetical protein
MGTENALFVQVARNCFRALAAGVFRENPDDDLCLFPDYLAFADATVLGGSYSVAVSYAAGRGAFQDTAELASLGFSPRSFRPIWAIMPITATCMWVISPRDGVMRLIPWNDN